MKDRDVERAARVAHEVNRVWCEENGDFSQPSWSDAPSWQIESAIQGVRFHLENPSAPDSASHDNWMNHKVSDGWVYGSVKCAIKKEHPCLVPFDDLSMCQQVKDSLFKSVIHSVLRF